MDAVAGDLIYIPADMPHLPFNPGTAPARAVIARTDPHEQESVVLLPELEGLVGWQWGDRPTVVQKTARHRPERDDA